MGTSILSASRGISKVIAKGAGAQSSELNATSFKRRPVYDAYSFMEIKAIWNNASRASVNYSTINQSMQANGHSQLRNPKSIANLFKIRNAFIFQILPYLSN